MKIVLLSLAALLLASCSPSVRVARYYKRYAHSYHQQQRKPLHNLPIHTLD